MKKYYKYKNFIPIEVVEREKSKEIKGNANGILLLVIINLYIFSTNLNLVKNLKNYEVNKPVKTENYIQSNEVSKWINVYKDFKEFKVENGYCEIVISKDEDIKSIESSNLKIKKATNEDDKVIVEVIYE